MLHADTTSSARQIMLSSQDADTAIDVNAVTVRFEGTYILKNLSLRIRRGESVVITGESGIGKSTLLRCLLGFVVPDSGTISIAGIKLTSETVWKVRRLMAYVPQEPELGEGTLEAWFRSPFSFRANADIKDNLQALPLWMERFALPRELLTKSVTELSGGEKQRSAIIGALLLQRSILLLDEPTSALDRNNIKRVLDGIFSIPDLTILAVSHDFELQERAGSVIALPFHHGTS